jgi:hypothetical protein
LLLIVHRDVVCLDLGHGIPPPNDHHSNRVAQETRVEEVSYALNGLSDGAC